jgi:hypothetical protein
MNVKYLILQKIKTSIIPIIFLPLFSVPAYSQIKFPKEFKLVRGERGSGADDEYTNGKYTFDTNMMFVSYEGSQEADSIKDYLINSYHFPFYTTKDGIFWGTGKSEEFYFYVVVTPQKHLIELYSRNNDSGFSNYSTWLLTTVRSYLQKGRDPYFPLRF